MMKLTDLPDTIPVFPLSGARPAARAPPPPPPPPAAAYLRAALSRHAGRLHENPDPPDRHDPTPRGAGIGRKAPVSHRLRGQADGVFGNRGWSLYGHPDRHLPLPAAR